MRAFARIPALMTAPRIALVTATAARDLDEDLPPLRDAMRDAGVDVAVCDWDDAKVDWRRFDAALLRSTWDYTMRLPEFMAWIERVAGLTRLLNPREVVRWNTDKHYLGDLARAGVATVPSTFLEPGAAAEAGLYAFLGAHRDREFVVKPAIGAGSRDAQRYGAGQHGDALPHIERLLDEQRSVLLQPYLDHVDEHGETALIFFAGAFSHAIRKGPLLQRNEGPTRALFAAEHISARVPSAAEMALAERTLAAMPFPTLLYARVDLIHDARLQPCVLELELTEPSLFFAHAPGSARRLTDAAAAWLRR
jgi:O-ureido-D-serine cyclo-ligase